MSETAHWDCWAWSGNRTVSRPEPSTTPEHAMELLLDKVRLVHGDQDWWTWEAPSNVREECVSPQRLSETVSAL